MSDSDRLLAIFPRNVWVFLLAQIKASDLLENLSNASPFFREMLLPRRVNFLFSGVWGASFDTFLQEMSKKDILLLRLVRPCWRDALDSSFTGQAYLNEYEEPDLADPLNTFAEGENFPFPPTHKRKSIPLFLQHFERTHGNGPATTNPFLVHKISIMVPNIVGLQHHLHGRDEYISSVTTLLTLYGHHLHICYLDVLNLGTGEQLEFYDVIRKWLLLMPNLYDLHILYSNNNKPSTVENAELYNSGILINPLMQLLRLKNLVTANLCPKLFNHLIKVHTHVSHLEVRAGHRAEYEVHTVHLVNLKRIYISYDESYYLIENLERAALGPNVSTLKLRGVIPRTYLRRLFIVLQTRFRNNLKHLQLIIILTESDPNPAGKLSKKSHKEIYALVMEPDDGSISANVDSDDDEDMDGASDEVVDEDMARICHHLRKKLLPGVTVFELKFELRPQVAVAVA